MCDREGHRITLTDTIKRQLAYDKKSAHKTWRCTERHGDDAPCIGWLASTNAGGSQYKTPCISWNRGDGENVTVIDGSNQAVPYTEAMKMNTEAIKMNSPFECIRKTLLEECATEVVMLCATLGIKHEKIDTLKTCLGISIDE